MNVCQLDLAALVISERGGILPSILDEGRADVALRAAGHDDTADEIVSLQGECAELAAMIRKLTDLGLTDAAKAVKVRLGQIECDLNSCWLDAEFFAQQAAREMIKTYGPTEAARMVHCDYAQAA